MKYKNIKKGILKSRPNRFIAIVNIEGNDETVHVKTTGRCKELLIPGSQVILSRSDNTARETKYDLIAVYKQGLGLVNIDSQAPNQVVKEWLLSQNYDKVQPEYKFGNSRLDFYLEKDDRKIFIEVKGCTLEVDGIGYFPDAPTGRGTKHLRELTNAVLEGYECCVVFVIQMAKVTEVRPNTAIDPLFSKALGEAKAAGVNVMCLQCIVTEDELKVR
ncbi:MAG: DNA/RNA nuclease SfsA [Oscillospiraceae bacterium]|nr:DNA/RNA nuclease SfsA [Oscillospiraceae bacterium]